jgi:hypothetical protein
MIRKRQKRHRRAFPHMARQAVLFRVSSAFGRRGRGNRMASLADRRIRPCCPLRVPMRVMASHARHFSAHSIAGARAQSHQLKSHRRRIPCLRLTSGAFRHPVAFRAQSNCRRPPHFRSCRLARMGRPRSMASLARHARRHGRKVGPLSNARRMTSEAPHDRNRVLPRAQRLLRARRWRPAMPNRPRRMLRRSIVRDPVFEIGALVLPHRSHRLRSRTERPFQQRLHPLLAFRNCHS